MLSLRKLFYFANASQKLIDIIYSTVMTIAQLAL